MQAVYKPVQGNAGRGDIENYLLCISGKTISKGEIPMAEKTTTAKSAAKEETRKETVEETKASEKEEAPAKKETKAAAKKTTTKKTTTRKTSAKKAAEPEKAEEKPVARRGAKKALSPVVHLQFGGKSYSMEDLQKIANDVWKYDLHNEEPYTSLELYVKPEENVAYYVFNGEINGNFFI